MKSTVTELVKRFIAGNEEAFAELVVRYRRKVYSVAYRIVGNHLDADEVVQESFVRVYNRKEDLDSVNHFSSFLIRVATNYSIDILRRRKGHGGVGEDTTSLPGEIQLDLARRIPTPADNYRGKRVMEEVRLALEKLPPKQKITAILHDIEGYSKTEIAEMFECPEATVRSNLHIARTKLRKILKQRLRTEE
jgi:RNA polymerase sigma-70 factor (ECF subfamily)